MGISVTVITKNEAADIAAALESVRWADEIVVVDSGSTDETVAIARRFTERVFVRDWPGYAAQKNVAASLASHDWILSLDADERVTPQLADEVRRIVSANPTDSAFKVPRVTWHLGQWIRTTDWYPDRQTRLYDRRRARWTGAYVHEGVAVDGTTGAANSAVTNMLGGSGDVHEAMIALQRAEMTMQLTVQVRNKLVAAYQDVMRMPI